MAYKSCVSLLLLLSVFITDNRTAATTSREKCECIKEAGSVPWRKITDYTITQKYQLCNKVEIVLQLSNKQVCLNPESKQGKQLQQCWKRIKFNSQRKRVCLAVKRNNKPKRSKKP